MDQTQMDTLILSIKVTDPVPKPPPVYTHNTGQVNSNSVINFGSAMGAKRYIYATAALSLKFFDHTTGKFPEITTSIAERSDSYG